MQIQLLTPEQLFESSLFKEAFTKEDMVLPLSELIEKIVEWMGKDDVNTMLHLETRLALGRLVNGLTDCNLAHSNLTALDIVTKEGRPFVSFSEEDNIINLKLLYLGLNSSSGKPLVELPPYLATTFTKLEPVFETVEWKTLTATDPLQLPTRDFIVVIRGIANNLKETSTKKLLTTLTGIIPRICEVENAKLLGQYIHTEQRFKYRGLGEETMNVLEVLVRMAGAMGELKLFTSHKLLLKKKR